MLKNEIWCNGNTIGFGPIILGSSPSISTKIKRRTGSL